MPTAAKSGVTHRISQVDSRKTEISDDGIREKVKHRRIGKSSLHFKK